jgi:hypothetical protein
MDRIRPAHDHLARVAQTLGQAAARAASRPDAPPPSTGPQEGEVVDAEFTDSDERRAG